MDLLLPYGGVKVSQSPFWIDMVTIVQTKVCYRQIKAGLGSIIPGLSGKHGPWRPEPGNHFLRRSWGYQYILYMGDRSSLVLIQLQYLYLYVFTEMTIFSLKIQTFAVSHNCLTFLLGAFNNSPLTPRQQRTKQTKPWSKPKSWPSTRPGDITTKKFLSLQCIASIADFWGNLRGKKGLWWFVVQIPLDSSHIVRSPARSQDFLQWRRQQQPLDFYQVTRGDRHAMGLFIEHDVYVVRTWEWETLGHFLPKCHQLEGPQMPGKNWNWLLPFRSIFDGSEFEGSAVDMENLHSGASISSNVNRIH